MQKRLVPIQTRLIPMGATMALKSDTQVFLQKEYTQKQYRQMWLNNVLYTANREDRAGALALAGGLLGGITLALFVAGVIVLVS